VVVPTGGAVTRLKVKSGCKRLDSAKAEDAKRVAKLKMIAKRRVMRVCPASAFFKSIAENLSNCYLKEEQWP
jgi:hypothetical protein